MNSMTEMNISVILREKIPIYARIICVVDSFDAMTSIRCYRSKLPMDEVVEELKDVQERSLIPILFHI